MKAVAKGYHSQRTGTKAVVRVQLLLMSSMKLQHRAIVQKGVHVNSSEGSSVTKESMQTVIVNEQSYIKYNLQEVMMTRVNRYSQT